MYNTLLVTVMSSGFRIPDLVPKENQGNHRGCSMKQAQSVIQTMTAAGGKSKNGPRQEGVSKATKGMLYERSNQIHRSVAYVKRKGYGTTRSQRRYSGL